MRDLARDVTRPFSFIIALIKKLYRRTYLLSPAYHSFESLDFMLHSHHTRGLSLVSFKTFLSPMNKKHSFMLVTVTSLRIKWYKLTVITAMQRIRFYSFLKCSILHHFLISSSIAFKSSSFLKAPEKSEPKN